MTQQDPTYRQATAQRNIGAILDAAEDLLESRSRTSIAAVAAHAGVSRVTVYAHFPTWESILEALVERAVGRTAAALDAARPEAGAPLAALERMLAVGWQELGRNAAMAQAVSDQLDPATITRTHQAALGKVADLAQRGQADGSFRTDMPAGWLVAAALALIHACGDEVRAGRLDPAAASQILTATIRDLFTGCQHNSQHRPDSATTPQKEASQ
jgi:TetR/AcrR family transcriptional regulator, mexCD-oprJ operon repressor